MTIGTKIRNDLRVVIHHERQVALLAAVSEIMATHTPGEPLIIPVLGPTRCGKSLLLSALKEANGRDIRGPGSTVPRPDFVVGKVPPKPNDRGFYAIPLGATGYAAFPRERMDALRDRLLEVVRRDGTRVIAFDEVHHFSERGANVSARTVGDHFKVLGDDTGCVLLLFGLPRFQRSVDVNEQFRDRCHATIYYLPYDWRVDAERAAFVDTLAHVLNIFISAGVELDLDFDDCLRSLYAASAGRIGMMLGLSEGAALALGENHVLRMEHFADAARKRLQNKARAATIFSLPFIEDSLLIRAYAEVLSESELPFDPQGAEDLVALHG
jgi:hypothetical protein